MSNLFYMKSFIYPKYPFWITMPSKLAEVFDEKIYNWILDIFCRPLSIPSDKESYRNLILLNDRDDNSEKSLIGRMLRYQFDLTNYILTKEISSFFETFSNGVSEEKEQYYYRQIINDRIVLTLITTNRNLLDYITDDYRKKKQSYCEKIRRGSIISIDTSLSKE